MDEQQWMQPLTAHIRALVQQRHFSEAENEAAKAMASAPHAAQPHNLMGIVSESRGNHVQAMKHFRAAWALDPTFLPARVNMERYGSFSGQMPRPVYDETECTPCPAESRRAYRIEYDENGIGHVVRRDN
ncbi:MAG: hypothetical protein MR821_09945 [Clostridiales bacterium]|nr:hypothetical protein [Clostridiales bacterium]